MDLTLQVLCLGFFSGTAGMLGRIVARSFARYLLKDDATVDFQGSMAGTCCWFAAFIILPLLAMKLHPDWSQTMIHCMLVQLTALVLPAFVIADILLRRVINGACDLLDVCFKR